MTHLTLVRHGETDWNRDRRIQGESDVPLNDVGRAQALATAELLAAEVSPEQPAVVVASNLSRAVETATIIAEVLGVAEPRVYADLRERGYGEAEGLTIEDFLERWGEWHTAQIVGAESSSDLRSRAIGALRQAVDDADRDASPVRVIAVTHGALIREVIRHASDDTLPQPDERLVNGSTHRFVVESDRVTLLSYEAFTPVASDL